jgi:hypothetical protein
VGGELGTSIASAGVLPSVWVDDAGVGADIPIASDNRDPAAVLSQATMQSNN